MDMRMYGRGIAYHAEVEVSCGIGELLEELREGVEEYEYEDERIEGIRWESLEFRMAVRTDFGHVLVPIRCVEGDFSVKVGYVGLNGDLLVRMAEMGN